ncbi:hypothetical protein AU375_03061 [Methylobacterium radiotolerans]|nr:hypothetical protein AU375_03061 [Methylobacterium radiotolerans]
MSFSVSVLGIILQNEPGGSILSHHLDFDLRPFGVSLLGTVESGLMDYLRYCAI